MGRPSCQSSLLSDPNPNFSVEMWWKSNMRRGRRVGLDTVLWPSHKRSPMEDHVEMGNFAGFAAPVLGSLILQRTGGNWNPLIYLFGAACVVWGIVALRMFEEQRDSASAAGGTFFYLTGRGHFAAGLALLSEVVPRLAATLKASMITSFVLLIHIPGPCAAPRNRLQWTRFFMAPGLAGSSWVAGSLRAFSWIWVRQSLRCEVYSRTANSR